MQYNMEVNMFCSNCGKTIKPEDAVCPHCGASMGENRFNGAMYISVQARIPAEETPDAPRGAVAYTRTDYMSYDNQPEPDVYSNTTYRPLLQQEEDERLNEEMQPEEQEETIEEAQEAPEEEPQDELNEEKQPDELYQEPEDVPAPDAREEAEDIPHIPLPQVEEGRINPDIEQFMQEFDEKQARSAERRQTSRFQMPSFLRRQETAMPEYDQEAYDAQREPAQEYAEEDGGYAASEGAPEDYQPEEYATEGYEDAEAYGEESYGEEAANPVTGFLTQLRTSLSGSVMLKRVLAGVVILAVLVAGVVWLSYVTAARSKIAGVTYEAYSQGTTLIKGYIDADYRSKFNDTYAVNATYAQSMLDTDRTTIAALLPAEPLENDSAFISSLTDMQRIIADTLLADAQAAKEGTSAERQTQSEQEWQIINNSVAKLLSATSVSELSTIGGQIAAAAQPTDTPAPTEPPTSYVTLQKGMKNSTAVQTLQARLIELGYLNDTADGAFGNNTLEAVKAFQRAAGLTVDGVATAQVQTALYALDAPEAPTPSPDPNTTDAPPEESQEPAEEPTDEPEA